MTTRGRIEHHTAGPRTGDTPSLRVVTFGRAGLRNSLSRWYVSRSGVIYLIALRTSWHAGPGSKGSNPVLSGTESEHSGSPSEPWTEASLSAQAAISQEECREFGVPHSRVWDHKEHAGYRGKIDRINIVPYRWRKRLDDPAEPSTGDDMFVQHGDRGEAVQYIQRLLLRAGEQLPKYGPDKDFGDETAAAIKSFWKRTTGEDYDGRVVTSAVMLGLHDEAFMREAVDGPGVLSESDQQFLSAFVAEGRKREDLQPASLWHVFDWLRYTRGFFSRYF